MARPERRREVDVHQLVARDLVVVRVLDADAIVEQAEVEALLGSVDFSGLRFGLPAPPTVKAGTSVPFTVDGDRIVELLGGEVARVLSGRTDRRAQPQRRDQRELLREEVLVAHAPTTR